jgi:hypothetical protein
MHREFHFAEPYHFGKFLLAVDGYFTAVVFLMVMDKSSRLDKHTACPANRVQDTAFVWLDHLDNKLNQRCGCIELTAALPFQTVKLAEKVFIYISEDVTFYIHGNLENILSSAISRSLSSRV